MRWYPVALIVASACGRIGFDDLGAPDAPPATTDHAFTSVTVGSRHACALDTDGHAYCWGDNASGQIGIGTMSEPIVLGTRAGAMTWTAIAAGGEMTCALDGNHAPWCWGLISGAVPAAIAEPPDAPPFEQISVGAKHACAIGAGQLWCWGASGLVDVDKTLQRIGTFDDWRAISASEHHTCGISAANGVLCWGENAYGEVRSPPSGLVGVPVPITLDGGVPIAVSTGGERSCAITAAAGATEGTLWCWGHNSELEIATPSADSLPPTQVGTSTTWSAVSTGSLHVCGIAAGARRCWGLGHFGELGDGIYADGNIAIGDARALEPADEVHANTDGDLGSTWFGCARRGTQIACWGENFYGELGIGTVTLARTAIIVPPPAGRTWRHIRAGNEHACGQTDDGALWCWGADDRGQVTGGTAGYGRDTPCTDATPCDVADPVRAPAEVGTPDEFVAGYNYTCARTGGTVRCWGDPILTGDVATPGVHEVAAPMGTWTRLYGGPFGTCGDHTSGVLACWGMNGIYHYQLPDSMGGELHDIGDIALDTDALCGVRTTDNARVCQGNNDVNQLGDGSTTAQGTAIAFDTGSIAHLASADKHSCAITTASRVRCWGSNYAAQAGQPQSKGAGIPMDVASSGGILDGCTALTVAGDHSCAVCNGTLSCWGQNVAAELGRGTQTLPDALAGEVVRPTSRPIVEIAASSGTGFVLDDQGTLACWGNFVRGTCGNSAHGVSFPTPVRVLE